MADNTAKIKYLEDEEGVVWLPVTHERAVLDNEGTTLEAKLGQKQATLVSGQNIKTINGDSILGSGNIEVQTEITMDNTPTAGSNNPVKSGGIYTSLQGKQATITTVNVSVDNNTGTPSATASVSGNTMDMNFYNMKGDPGVAGPTPEFSVGTVSTLPPGSQATVSITGTTNAPILNMGIPAGATGEQGNSGYSGDIEDLEIVNNLTDGGATAALSAEMGKQLGNKVRIISDVTASGLSFADSNGNIMVTINDYGLDAARLTTHFKSLISGQSVVETKDDEIVSHYGLPLLDTMRSKVIEHNLNNRFLNFAFITDTHTEGTHQIFALNAVRNMKLFRIWCNEKIVDFGIHCGDIYTDYATSRDEALRLIDSSTQILCDIDCPMFFVKGNHDNNGKGRYEADLSNLDWDNNQYYIAQVTNYGLANAAFSYVRVYEDTWDGESTLYVGGNVKALNITKYQYYLLTQKLSDNEVTRSDTDPYGAYYYKDYSELGVRVVMLNFYDQEAQDQTYGYWEAGGLSTTQMNWLNNVALDTENEVIVFCHWYNAALTSALGTFVNNGGKLIAFIHGHSHEDQYENTGGFNNIGVRNGFGITTEMTADPNKSFAFSAFTVDTVNKVLYETRLGKGIDRSFSYDTPAQL